MSSAYWNQWEDIEIDSMHGVAHGIDHEQDLDLHIMEEGKTDEDDEPIEYNYTTWEAI